MLADNRFAMQQRQRPIDKGGKGLDFPGDGGIDGRPGGQRALLGHINAQGAQIFLHGPVRGNENTFVAVPAAKGLEIFILGQHERRGSQSLGQG